MATITLILKGIMLFFTRWLEIDKEKREVKKKAIKKMNEGFKKRSRKEILDAINDGMNP